RLARVARERDRSQRPGPHPRNRTRKRAPAPHTRDSPHRHPPLRRRRRAPMERPHSGVGTNRRPPRPRRRERYVAHASARATPPVTTADLAQPDEAAMELAPGPGVASDDVSLGSSGVKAVLGEMRLVGRPTIRGARGMHINGRTRPRWTFTDVGRAAVALSRA